MKLLAKQNNIKKLILTSVLSCVFIGLSMNIDEDLGSLLLIASYISSLAFFKFVFLSKEKNLCFLIIFGSVPFCVALFLLPLSVFIFMAFIKKNKQNEQADTMYHRAKDEYKKGQFIHAEQTICSAIKLVNKAKYQDLLKNIKLVRLKNEKVINQEHKDISVKVDNNKNLKISSNSNETRKQVENIEHKSSEIILESCSVEELLEIDGFDEEKAEKFIQERENGKRYYDIETFVDEFELMPHQMVEIQNRLVFPVRPKNKIGRKIDW